MRLRLAVSPWWLQGLVYGVFFGAAMTVFNRFEFGRWLPAAATGAITGVLFGVGMGVTMSRLNRRMLAGLEDLAPDELRIVTRAAARGPAPTDPRLRAAAAGLVERQRDEALRTRRRSALTFAVFLVLYVTLVLTDSWWWGLAIMLFLGFAALAWRAPARLDRRLAILNPGPGTAADLQPR